MFIFSLFKLYLMMMIYKITSLIYHYQSRHGSRLENVNTVKGVSKKLLSRKTLFVTSFTMKKWILKLGTSFVSGLNTREEIISKMRGYKSEGYIELHFVTTVFDTLQSTIVKFQYDRNYYEGLSSKQQCQSLLNVKALSLTVIFVRLRKKVIQQYIQ